MFGSMSGYGDASTQEAPKKARQEENATCMPVTVRVLQDAIARHKDSQEVLIHGKEVAYVQLVGTVEQLKNQSATCEFVINDASGRMNVRYYGTGSGAMEAIKGVAPGRYVSIVGNLRTSPSPHISAMTVQAVASADEISYHMIAVAHAALRLKNPTKSAGLSIGATVTDPTTPAKLSQGLAFGGAGTANTLSSPVKAEGPVAVQAMQTPPAKQPQDLRTSVVEILRQVQEQGSAEGVDVSMLLGRIAGASSEKVKDVLNTLVDEGEAFTTIDDDHFSMI